MPAVSNKIPDSKRVVAILLGNLETINLFTLRSYVTDSIAENFSTFENFSLLAATDFEYFGFTVKYFILMTSGRKRKTIEGYFYDSNFSLFSKDRYVKQQDGLQGVVQSRLIQIYSSHDYVSSSCPPVSNLSPEENK